MACCPLGTYGRVSIQKQNLWLVCTSRTAPSLEAGDKFYISSKYLLPPQRRLRSFLGVTLTGDLVEEADGGLRSCPIPF